MTAETTEEDIPETFETELRENASGQFEYVLPASLAEYHGLDDDDVNAVSYRVIPKYVGEPRPTELAYEITPSKIEGYVPGRRSVIQHTNNRVTIRIPATLASERGFDERLDRGESVTLYVTSPKQGVLHVTPDPYNGNPGPNRIDKLDPISDPITNKGFSEKSHGEDAEYTGYRLIIPQRFNDLYDFTSRGKVQWDLALHGDEVVLVATLLDEDATEAETARSNVSSWHELDVGNVVMDDPFLVSQIQMYVPINLVRSLEWENLGLRLTPEENRIVISAVDLS